MASKFRRFTGYVFRTKWTLLSLIIINMIGFFIGIYYYLDELAVHPPYLWPIVMDCPVAVLLFSVICIFYLAKRKFHNLLVFFTSVYMIKYGLWTLTAIVLYWNFYMPGIDQTIAALNFILHTGLILEGITLSGKVSKNQYNAVIVLTLALVNDFFDYFMGTLQNMPHTYVGILMIESIIVSVALPVAVYLFRNQTRSEKSEGSKGRSKP
ncbi:MAG: DUF1405 domain-containing protein [Candidatus Aenigmarchaeota archaeon]|nr:DUF1405 domain-containing protein [Candidatus Aenigmarchaeota archaeon]